jgi:hypothetical protein
MALQITTQQPACAFVPCGGGLRSIQSQPILVNLLSERMGRHILRTPSSSMLMSSVLSPEMDSVVEKVERTSFDAKKSLALTLVRYTLQRDLSRLSTNPFFPRVSPPTCTSLVLTHAFSSIII